MSAPDALYSAAWSGLRRSLQDMERKMSGTPEHLVATSQAEVWLDVLVIVCPERTRDDLLATAVRKIPARS